jgi:hypothetical protein
MKWHWTNQPSWGMSLLGVWLIAGGLLPLLGIGGPLVYQLLAVLAVATGVLVLLQR